MLDRVFFYIFFNDTATTEIYTLSLHDALPIFGRPQPGAAPAQRHAGGQHARQRRPRRRGRQDLPGRRRRGGRRVLRLRSEEHTSELQSRQYLVCRLLLEKKKK